MKSNIFLKICGAVLLVLTLNACTTMSEMGTTVMSGASKGVDAVKDVFTPAEKK